MGLGLNPIVTVFRLWTTVLVSLVPVVNSILRGVAGFGLVICDTTIKLANLSASFS